MPRLLANHADNDTCYATKCVHVCVCVLLTGNMRANDEISIIRPRAHRCTAYVRLFAICDIILAGALFVASIIARLLLRVVRSESYYIASNFTIHAARAAEDTSGGESSCEKEKSSEARHDTRVLL